MQSRLLNPTVFVDAGKLIVAMAEVLVDAALPPRAPARERRALHAPRGEPSSRLPSRAIGGFEQRAFSNAPSSLGTFLAWKALGRVLGPSDRTEGWTSSHCPTCGALPAMAQLRQSDRERARALFVASAARGGATRASAAVLQERDAEAARGPRAGRRARVPDRCLPAVQRVSEDVCGRRGRVVGPLRLVHAAPRRRLQRAQVRDRRSTRSVRPRRRRSPGPRGSGRWRPRWPRHPASPRSSPTGR